MDILLFCKSNKGKEIKNIEKSFDKCSIKNEFQSLADHDKQVRKEVCEEIRKFYTTPIYDRENPHTDVRVLLSRLDQVLGETK